MERTVLKYAPSYWNTNYEDDKQFELIRSCDEYRRIEYQVRQAIRNHNIEIRRILRNQNVYDFGQVLIREQLMAVSKCDNSYYRVRRFITIREQYLSNALKYNLDYRRCGKANLIFANNIDYPNHDDVILVVQVITDTPNANNIQPSSSSDYFIDYIVTLQ